MTRNIWIGIILVILLVAGGWWYFNQSSIPTASETTQLPAQETTQQNTNNTETQLSQPAQTSPAVTTQPATSAGFSASPTSGSAPLLVKFSAPIHYEQVIPNVVAAPYSIIFGDGTSDVMQEVDTMCVPEESWRTCTAKVTANHTYTSPGKYSVTAQKVNGDSIAILGTVTITTTNSH